MSAPLRQYPDYQPMDAPWCPRIPAHWQSKRLGSLLRERGEVNHDYKEQNVLSVLRDIGVIPYADKGNVGNKKSEDIARYKIVRPNDIVLNSMNVIIGSVGRSRYQGCLSPVYYVLTPRNSELTAEFAESIFQVKPFQQSLIRIGYGILAHRMRIPMELLKSEVLPLPPPDEQAQIVRFIRHLDQRVNRLIKTKRRLIELLNEQKQAIIHRAVTRGLDPTVPLKPSGIDWLGEVPEHWKVKRVRHVTEMLVSNVDKHSHENEETVRLCNYVDVYKNEAINDQLKFMVATASKDEMERFRIKIGDVIITKDSELWSDIGVPAVVRYEADDLVCGYHLAILRPKEDELSGEFLLRCLQDRLIATQLHVAANGITRYGLSQGSIKSCLIPVPPLVEQGELVSHLMEATRDLTLAISKAQAEIDLIREYRTRLVADVVTGQLDVRHLDLPEVEESLIEAIDADTDDGDDSEEGEDGEV